MKETPVLMGADRTLFGVCTEPKDRAGCGVIILNAGLLHHIGPYRLHVTLARALLELGCLTIRLDQSGKGESPLRKGLSSEEALLKDFDDTVEELSRRGVTSVFLVGLCSGADDSLFIAQHRSNLSGLILLDGYAVRTRRFYYNHYRSRVFKAGSWIRTLRRMLQRVLMQRGAGEPQSVLDIRNWASADDMKARFAKVLHNGSSLLAIFTGGVEYYYNYQGQLANFLGLKQRDRRFTEVYYPEAGHTFPLLKHRTRLIDEIRGWFAEQIRAQIGKQ